MPAFSRRSKLDLNENHFTLALRRAREEAGTLFDLSAGSLCDVGLSFEAEELHALLCQPELAHYDPHPFGLPSARAAVMRDLATRGIATSVERVMLTASTSEAYGFLFKLLCDSGDAVLVPEPSYPLLAMLSQLEGVKLVPYPLRYDGEWHVDLPALREAHASIRDEARAIVTVQPNNPTGSFLSAEELAALCDIGLPIISDEVFGDYAYLNRDATSPSALSCRERNLVFRLSGLSKELALPQLKLAYTVVDGPEALTRQALARLEHIADTYLSPATPVQLALPALLAQRPRIQSAIRARIVQNRQTLITALTSSSASVLQAQGGFYAVVRLPNVTSDEQFCIDLLERYRVICQPGYFFDLPSVHLVVSLIVPAQTLVHGATLLRKAIDAL